MPPTGADALANFASFKMRLRRTLWVLSALAVASLIASPALCFPHTVKEGDTLAGLAERFYGRIQHEKLLVAANGLESHGGTSIVPGMRIEVPSVTYIRIQGGETWMELATTYLGARVRAHALAVANDTKAWLPPETGQEVLLPYNLRIIATGNETLVGLAYKYLGDRKQAWMLDHYNGRKGRRLKRGEVILVPLTDIPLTKAGKRAARYALTGLEQESAGEDRRAQARAHRELPALKSFNARGQYVEAVRLAVGLLADTRLTRSQIGHIHGELLRAYAALNATGRARESCEIWLENSSDPKRQLDPLLVSPKILKHCPESAQPSVPSDAKGTEQDSPAKGPAKQAVGKDADKKQATKKGGNK